MCKGVCRCVCVCVCPCVSRVIFGRDTNCRLANMCTYIHAHTRTHTNNNNNSNSNNNNNSNYYDNVHMKPSFETF